MVFISGGSSLSCDGESSVVKFTLQLSKRRLEEGSDMWLKAPDKASKWTFEFRFLFFLFNYYSQGQKNLSNQWLLILFSYFQKCKKSPRYECCHLIKIMNS